MPPAARPLASPVALVTGASSGIGDAITQRLLEGRWTVYAAARRVARMRALEHAGARLLALDVSDDDSMCAAVSRITAEEGRLDALVNNAGYGAYGALEDVPMEEGRRQFDVNVFGPARLTQLVLPTMRTQARGRWARARIVNVSSIGGKIHEPMGCWYHATKFALEGLSDCLRMELAPFDIDVVVIEPGAIKTEWAGLARDALLSTSGATAYAAQARATAGLLAGADDRSAAPPALVADAVWRALTDKRPKTRYAVGGGAALLLFLRRVLSDRSFDRVMRAATSRMAGAR